MKKILIIKNGSCDVERALRKVICSIEENIVFDVIMSCDLIKSKFPADCLSYNAIIICGGQQSLTEKSYSHIYLNDLIEYTKIWINSNAKVLGICLGAQVIGEACGFRTTKMLKPIIGYQKNIQIVSNNDASLMDSSFVPYTSYLLCCHYDHIHINNNVTIEAYLYCDCKNCNNRLSQDGDIQGERIPYAFRIKNAYGVQFHPEIDVDILRQIKCVYTELIEHFKFAESNEEMIHMTTIKFFKKWLATI